MTKRDSYRTELRGKYVIADRAYLERKANETADPVHIFYRAMLKHEQYAGYLAEVGHLEVKKLPGKRTGRPYVARGGTTTGRLEILYARRNGKVVDIQRL